MQDQVDLTMVTFSKSFASIGGAVAGPESVIHYLKHHARALIFSASMPPSAVATVLACLDVMEQEPERRERLWQNAEYMRNGLKSLGFDTVTSETPASRATSSMRGVPVPCAAPGSLLPDDAAVIPDDLVRDIPILSAADAGLAPDEIHCTEAGATEMDGIAPRAAGA